VEGLNNTLGNSFSILNKVDHAYLHNLAIDLEISVGGREDEVIQQVDSFMSQELAQQAIEQFEKEKMKQ
jgi:hypothetical protein